MNVITFIIKQFPLNLKLNLFLILFLSLTNSVLEVIGIGMLIPIFKIVENFDNFSIYLVENFHLLSFVSNLNQAQLLNIALIFFLGILSLKYLNYLYFNRLAINFSAKSKIFLSSRIFYSFSSRDYIFFKNKNSSLILKDVLIEVTEFCDRFILSGLNLVIECLIIFLVTFFLLFKETKLIFFFIIYLFPFYFIFYVFIKNKIEKASLIRSELDERKIFIVKNFLNNIKVIKTQNKENFFINIFTKYISNFEFTFANFNFVQIISRPYFEFVGLFFIFAWLIISINQGVLLKDIFLSFTILVVACIRILPSINRVAYNWGQVKFSKPSIKIIYRELNNVLQVLGSNFLNKKNIKFNYEICLKNISFKYSEKEPNVLNELSLEIKKNDKICILGESGSGKTTLIEIIAGLLKPTTGSVVIDKDFFFNNTNERLQLTYIPQDLTLMDGTIADNICLGEEVDPQKLKLAMKNSLVETFLNDDANNIYTDVGEVGKKFSGGQRQRINLARSFYENNDLIIFDESINAIDHEMKLILVENIFLQLKKKTIIFALHDKSFLHKFDKIYELKNGKLTRL
jgi:ATP-binding cassette subfamily B protein